MSAAMEKESPPGRQGLIEPYGGPLVDLLLGQEELRLAREEAARAPAITLDEVELCDLELLATGGFSPLRGFMGRSDYERVLEEMRLADGTLWPLPIVLRAPPDLKVGPGGSVALRDAKANILALLDVDDVFDADIEAERARICGGSDEHPWMAFLRSRNSRRLGGRLRVLALPVHHDFARLRRTPVQTRAMLSGLGWREVAAFQTRNPLHRAHEELIRRAAAQADGVLVHPVAGVTRPGDIDHYTRIRCYLATMKHLDPRRTALSLLPLAMRMAGPREALLHAIVRRNYGASALVVGRDHAGPGRDSSGRPFYGPYEAREALLRHERETGVRPLPFEELVYVPERKSYCPAGELPAGCSALSISGTEVREKYLAAGRPLPDWFARPEVAELLAQAFPPRHEQGFTVWITGLPASGKSTLAELLAVKLLERGRRSTVLDGDIVRRHLSKGLGFSRDDRDENIRRIGFVAAEITRHGGVCICAAISPYKRIREENRALIGNYVEVYANAPLAVCEARDSKGLFKAAREGRLTGVTGIDDPYEPPERDFVECRTDSETPEESVAKILRRLEELGYLRG